MKLSKKDIITLNDISKKDADIRMREFHSFLNLEPSFENYDFNEIKELWPEAEYFDIKHIEGLCGVMDGRSVFIFRGTDSLVGWITNVMFGKKVIPYDGTNPEIKVHNGFLQDYLLVRDYIHTKVKEYNTKEILIHGHSKGAAISALCALDLQYNFSDKEIGCFVIGMPRVGNAAFKKSFEGRLPNFTRATYGSDLVPQLPPHCFGFEHLNSFIQLGPERRRGIGKISHHDYNKYNEALKNELKDEKYS